MRSDAAYGELQAIAGFFAEVAGQALPFWVAPPGLSAVTGAALGTGDGSTTSFALVQQIGGASLPVYGCSGVSAVYLNGAPQAIGWTVSSGYAPAIAFTAAPSAGVAVSADLGALWLCRFVDDAQNLEEFMATLWRLKTLRLSTTRP